MITREICSMCNAAIVRCDNNVLLDVPAVAYDPNGASWWVMQLGDRDIAVGGCEPPAEGHAHTLHKHQKFIMTKPEG